MIMMKMRSLHLLSIAVTAINAVETVCLIVANLKRRRQAAYSRGSIHFSLFFPICISLRH